MSYGYQGKILRLNLTTKKIKVERPAETFYRKYFGGTGMTSYFLAKEVPKEVKPFDPENKLVFSTGVLSGTPLPGAGRANVGAKSPLTGGFGDSQGGEYWGPELKRAGYDVVIVEGKAEKPVYIAIKNDEVEICNGAHLKGLATLEVQEKIAEEVGDSRVRIAQAGIAGENMVRYACVLFDLTHASGRGGMGAVMGSKNLRAIAVRGTGTVEVYDRDALREDVRSAIERIRDSTHSLTELGTAGTTLVNNTLGGLPTRNFQDGHFEGANEISGETMRDTILIDRDGCYACPVNCKRVVSCNGKYKVDPKYGGPEYETIASLGPTCGVDDLEAIAKGNELCNAYGLDSISTGVAIAFAMECYENGLIDKEDTDGIDLRFGNADAMVQMVEKIAKRDGLGKLLGEGVKRASEQIKGSEKFAMHVKGQEIPMHEPRLKMGLGVGYCISPTGADHCHNMHDTLFEQAEAMTELNALGLFEPLARDDLSGNKVRLLYYVSQLKHFSDCGTICSFIPWTPIEIVQLVRDVTGWDFSLFELMKIAQRATTLARIFNVREGFDKAMDDLPGRFFEPFTSGPLEGVAIHREALLKARDQYYGMMYWNADGVPTEVGLFELGIGWAASEVSAK